jgi:hypothetical protein
MTVHCCINSNVGLSQQTAMPIVAATTCVIRKKMMQSKSQRLNGRMVATDSNIQALAA